MKRMGDPETKAKRPEKENAPANAYVMNCGCLRMAQKP
jgi:hypothetical protein